MMDMEDSVSTSARGRGDDRRQSDRGSDSESGRGDDGGQGDRGGDSESGRGDDGGQGGTEDESGNKDVRHRSDRDNEGDRGDDGETKVKSSLVQHDDKPPMEPVELRACKYHGDKPPREPVELKMCMGETWKFNKIVARISSHICKCQRFANAEMDHSLKCEDEVCDYFSWYYCHYSLCSAKFGEDVSCLHCQRFVRWIHSHTTSCVYDSGCVLGVCQDSKKQWLRRNMKQFSLDAIRIVMSHERQAKETLSKPFEENEETIQERMAFFKEYLQGQFNRHQVYREGQHWNRLWRIGTGGQSTCYTIADMQTNSLLALKEGGETDTTVDEVYICLKLSYLKPPNIVEYFGAAMLPFSPQRGLVQIFMELMPICMQGYLFKNGPICCEIVCNLASQLFRAVEFLHNKMKIVHCAIKPANVLFDYNQQRLKVADFSCAELLEECHRGPCFRGNEKAGTLAYNPPEYYSDKRCSFAFDIWQSGCTVLAMLTGKRPWRNLFMDCADPRGKNNPRVIKMKGLYRMMISRQSAHMLPSFIGESLQQLLFGCIHSDSSNRLSAQDCSYLLATTEANSRSHEVLLDYRPPPPSVDIYLGTLRHNACVRDIEHVLMGGWLGTVPYHDGMTYQDIRDRISLTNFPVSRYFGDYQFAVSENQPQGIWRTINEYDRGVEFVPVRESSLVDITKAVILKPLPLTGHSFGSVLPKEEIRNFEQVASRLSSELLPPHGSGRNLSAALPLADAQRSTWNITVTQSDKKLLEEAMKEGYINASFLKVIFTGAGGVGKTHTVCLLRGVDPPDPNHRQSTDCATKAVLLRVDAASDEQWEEIDLENRKKIIAEAIWAAKETAELKKAVNPPSTQKLQPEAEPKPKSEQHPKAEPKPKLKPEQQQPETDPRLLLEMQQEKLSLQSQPLKTEVDLIKCIHEAAMSGEVGGEILETKWVYAIDTGGQPPFHELLSAFIKGASVCAFVFKLSESLDHRPLVEYWVDGTEVGQPFEHPLSNRQILEQSIQTVQALPSLSDEYSQSECSQSPLLLVIGTHRDQQNECTNETLQDKEETLHEIQQKSGCNFQFNNRGGAERIVFDVNAKNPEPKDKAIASTLRTVIAKAMPKPEKIPLRHYGLELELEHLAITKPVISMEECRAIGGRLNFDENGLKAALRFLHRLNVLLYYPEVKEVKELVFCDPLVLIKIASKVVEHIHRGENTAWKDSRERGLIAVEQLNDAEFDRCFKSQIFTAEHLFKLFKHLLIVAMVKPNQQFFMPSLLNELTTTELEKKRPYSSHCIPLTFQFRKEGRSVYAPSGLFSALVAFLLSLKSRYSELCSWEIAEISGNLYRNIIRFQSHLPLVDITLMNFHTHFEVFAICQRNITHKYLPEVQKIINKGLVEVKKVRNFDHVNYSETFPCKCSKATIKPHLAVIDIREKSWCCPHDKSQGGPLEPTELVWFDRSPASSGEGNSSGDTCAVTKPPTLDELTDHVKTTKWHKLGQKLGVEKFDLDVIQKDNPQNTEGALEAMLKKWLEITKYSTWRAIVDALETIEERQLAKKLETQFCPGRAERSGDRSSIAEPRRAGLDPEFSSRQQRTAVCKSGRAERSGDRSSIPELKRERLDLESGSRQQRTSATAKILTESPSMKKLKLLKGPGDQKVNIVASVAEKWKDIGFQLDFDDTGQQLDAIETCCKNDPLSCCHAMFQHWLKGNGVDRTWGTLIAILKDCELGTLADQVWMALDHST